MKYQSLISILLVIFCLTSFFNYARAAGSATLSWSVNKELDLAGYRIYYGASPRNGGCPPGGYPNKIDVGKTNTPDKPSYTIGNLEDGKTYYFSLTSYDISGNESCFSGEINKIIPEAKISWYQQITRFFQEVFSPLTLFSQKIF